MRAVPLTLALLVGCSDITLTEKDDEADESAGGGDPRARVEPDFVDFGEVAVSDVPDEQLSVTVAVTIYNDGGATLLIRDVSMDEDDPAFAVGSVALPSVPSDGALEIDLTFNPTATGVATDALRIDTNDPQRSVWVVELEGSGVRGR